MSVKGSSWEHWLPAETFWRPWLASFRERSAAWAYFTSHDFPGMRIDEWDLLGETRWEVSYFDAEKFDDWNVRRQPVKSKWEFIPLEELKREHGL